MRQSKRKRENEVEGKEETERRKTRRERRKSDIRGKGMKELEGIWT